MKQKKFNTIEAANYLRLKPSTLEAWRCHGRGPQYYRLGRRIVYDLDQLEAFARSCVVFTADSPPQDGRRA